MALLKEFDSVEGLGPIAGAAAAFVGTHFLLSHPLRKPIVDTVGSAAFLGIYSAVAAATLGWLALAYSCRACGYAVVAGRQWPMGGGDGRDAGGVGPAGPMRGSLTRTAHFVLIFAKDIAAEPEI